jgi:hypothetical protein
MKSIYYLLNILRICRNSDRLVIFIRSDHFGHIVNRLDYYQRITSEKKIFYVLTSLKIDAATLEYFGSETSEILYHCISGSSYFKQKIRSLVYYFAQIFSIISFGTRAITNTDHIYKILLGVSAKSKIFDIHTGTHLIAYHAPVHQIHTHRYFVNPDIGLNTSTLHIVDDCLKGAFGKEIEDIKLVAIKLRDVKYKTDRYHDSGRNCFSVDCYVPLVRLLIQRGYSVIVDAEQAIPELHELPVIQLFDLMNVKIRTVVRTYYLTYGYFVLQQHSGPVHLCNIAGVRNIIIDSFPLWQGTWSERDFIVPQEVTFIPESRRLGLVEICIKHPDLYLGKYDSVRYKFGPSRIEYIESCIDEIEGLYSDRSQMEALEVARMKFRAIIPNDALNKIALSKLPKALVMGSEL